MENIKNEIISNSMHQIIYGSNNEERKKLLMELSKENPIAIDENKPFAVYVDDLAPIVKEINENCDTTMLSVLCKDYLDYSIAHQITIELGKIGLDKKRIDNILERVNSLYLNDNRKNIETLDELILEFYNTKAYYSKKFQELALTGKVNFNICKSSFIFFELERYIRKIKTFLNNESYVAILINHEQNLYSESMKVVNNLIASRINKDISIKLATAKQDWKTYVAQNGQFIEATHDYGIIYLDDEQKDLTKHLI